MSLNIAPGGLRRMCLACAVAVAAAATTMGALACATASGPELGANPSNLGSVFAAARPGDTIRLEAGDYGVFHGGQKAGKVTLQPATGAAVAMQLSFNPASNITIDGVTLTNVEIADSRTKNITVRNSDIRGPTTFRTGELQNANILFDHNVHRDWNTCSSCGEGRIWLPERSETTPSGITISNSEFKGGLSDGIQNGSNGTRILNNVFHDLTMGTPDGVHTDAIQLYGSKNTLIKGNYFYDVPDAIMVPDGADHEVIEDNVVAADRDGYPFAVTLYSDDGSIIRHNTFADGACAFNLRCGIVRVGSKSGDNAGRGTIIEDNVLGEISYGGGSAAIARTSHNLFTTSASGLASLRGKPTFVGGATPTDYAGFALEPGSLGTGSAGDGLDRGIRVGPATRPAGSTRRTTGARVLSSLRSIRKTGRLRIRIVTPADGLVVASGRIRPGRARARYRKVHSGAVMNLRTVSLGELAAGVHTFTFRLGRTARRRLGRARDAGLTLTVTVAGQMTRTKLAIKR
jgi:hypothetical protein